jgi:Ni/Fe-hydrogenase subunit HybB-like protein
VDSEGSQKLAEVQRPEPLIGPDYTLGSVTEKISDIVLVRRTTKSWIFGFLLAFSLLMLLNLVVSLLMVKGVGIWGINIPVGWAFAITNFVWWIGIGHAGTLISAFLLLMHQKWRTSINRFAEAMTIFAVMCAGMFPLLHMGRPWLFFYLMPYPNPMWLWPQFRSPLVWDVFAVSTYFTVSLLFWFVGLVPDLATLRDRAKNKVSKLVYGLFAMGWRGSAIHWSRYEFASLLLAGLATPLVVSVHTVVSFDFAIAMVPGWHSTIFPPYFVAGAIYSGFAMVLSLAIPLRKYFHLGDLITMKHLDIMGKVMLATGMIVAYSYIVEAFMCFYSANQYDRFMILNRLMGPYKYVYWSLITCNLIIPQVLWFRNVRRRTTYLFLF